MEQNKINTQEDVRWRLANEIVRMQEERGSRLTAEEIVAVADLLGIKDAALCTTEPERKVTEVRPKTLECDVVRFQNNKEKWVAFVGLLDGYPYEIFTGLQDDEEGIVLPKTVTKGKIIKSMNDDGTRRYDFQF